MKKIKSLSAIIIIVLLASGCAINTGSKVYDNEKKIAEDYNSYNLVRSKQSIVENCLTGSAETLEGMGTIWEFQAAEDMDVHITYRLKVSSGKAKLVFIAPDGKITTLIECTADAKQESSDLFRVTKGENRMKLIGAENTSIEFEISVDEGEVKSFGG